MDFLARAPINKLPVGMLDFLGIKSLGKNPDTIGTQVQPVMDLTEWYALTNVRTPGSQGTQNTDLPQDLANFGPPAGFMWYVIQVSALTLTTNLNAGQVFSACIHRQRANGPSFPLQCYEPVTTHAAAWRYTLAGPSGFLLGPGWELALKSNLATNFAAAPKNISFRAVVLELQI